MALTLQSPHDRLDRPPPVDVPRTAVPTEIEFPLARKGYAPAAVRAFVAASSMELTRLTTMNAELQARVAELEWHAAAQARAAMAAPTMPSPTTAARSEIEPRTAPLFPPRVEAGAPSAEAAEAIAHARRQADEIVRLAREEAAQIVAAARQHQPNATGIDPVQRNRVLAEIEHQRRVANEAIAQAHEQMARVERRRETITSGLHVLQEALRRATDDLSTPVTNAAALSSPPAPLPELRR